MTLLGSFVLLNILLLSSVCCCLITRPNIDVWKLMADLFNIISDLNTSAVVLNEKKTDGNIIFSTIFLSKYKVS